MKTKVLAKVEDALLTIYDYCNKDCDNCIFDSCIVNKAYNLRSELISGIAHSFGIVEDIPFKIKPIETRTVSESIRIREMQSNYDYIRSLNIHDLAEYLREFVGNELSLCEIKHMLADYREDGGL